MKWDMPQPGEWIQPITRAYKLGCCDCGLVHSVHFRVYDGRAQFKVYRDEKLTRSERAKKSKKS